MFPTHNPIYKAPVVVVFLVCPAVFAKVHEKMIGVIGWKICKMK
jgi:hypothetical protein